MKFIRFGPTGMVGQACCANQNGKKEGYPKQVLDIDRV
jgi:hypothetical protein